MNLTKDNKQATIRNRYSILSSFYNFSINTGLPFLVNPCNTTVIKKIFKLPPPIQWQIVDKDTIDEISFRTTDKRNRLMLLSMLHGQEHQLRSSARSFCTMLTSPRPGRYLGKVNETEAIRWIETLYG